uniref:Uncharacterized protein n=1 Tax=Sphaerodactylus townsendi TaxID=933632 RepID=A0ACB8G3Y0_9SAUR
MNSTALGSGLPGGMWGEGAELLTLGFFPQLFWTFLSPTLSTACFIPFYDAASLSMSYCDSRSEARELFHFSLQENFSLCNALSSSMCSKAPRRGCFPLLYIWRRWGAGCWGIGRRLNIPQIHVRKASD